MFRHIVLFALDKDKFASKAEKEKQLEEIKTALEALPKVIDSLSELRVYFNENPDESYDFMLEAYLPTAEDLPSYALHPEHIKVAKELVKPYIKSRACVDFNQ